MNTRPAAIEERCLLDPGSEERVRIQEAYVLAAAELICVVLEELCAGAPALKLEQALREVHLVASG
jgi:hypothetical protein